MKSIAAKLDRHISILFRLAGAYLTVQAILILIAAARGTAPEFVDVCTLCVVAFSAPMMAADAVSDFRRALGR